MKQGRSSPKYLSWQCVIPLDNATGSGIHVVHSLQFLEEISRYSIPETDLVRGGKSTLIRALIRNAAANTYDDVPIPGHHAEKYRSTSGGVHLYCDPRTIDSDVPLLYAGLFETSVSEITNSVMQTAKGFVVALSQWQLTPSKRAFTSPHPGNIMISTPHEIVRALVGVDPWTTTERPLFVQCLCIGLKTSLSGQIEEQRSWYIQILGRSLSRSSIRDSYIPFRMSCAM